MAIFSGLVSTQLCSRGHIFFHGFLASLALGRERAGGGAFVIGGDGAIHVAGLRVGVAQQVVVDRIRACRERHGLCQFGPGIVVFLMIDREQAQSAVTQRELVILGLLKCGIVDRRRLFQAGNQFDGVVGVHFGFL